MVPILLGKTGADPGARDAVGVLASVRTDAQTVWKDGLGFEVHGWGKVVAPTHTF